MTATTSSPLPAARQAAPAHDAAGEGSGPPQAAGKRKEAPASAPTAGELSTKRHRSQAIMRVKLVSQGLFANITPPPGRRLAGGDPGSQPVPGRHASRWQAGMSAIPLSFSLSPIAEEVLEPGSPLASPPRPCPELPLTPPPAKRHRLASSARGELPLASERAKRHQPAPPSFPRPSASPQPSPYVALDVRPSPPRASAAPAAPPAPAPAAGAAGARSDLLDPVPAASAASAAPRAWPPAAGTRLREAFPQAQERVAALQRRAVESRYGGTGGDPLALLDELHRALRHVAWSVMVRDPERELATLETLVSASITPAQLPGLVSRGSRWDLLQTALNSTLLFGASFAMAGGVTSLLEPEAAGLVSDPLGTSPDAGAMPPWMGAALIHLLGDLIIGVGAEWAAAVLREGKLDQPYNRRQDFTRGEDGRPQAFAETTAGRWVQALSALPFAALYIAHRRFPEFMGPPLARLGMGATAAASSGLWREGMAQALASESDPVWLDSSIRKPLASESDLPLHVGLDLKYARQDQMDTALRHLQSPANALSEGVQALWQGVRGATSRPKMDASVRAALRTVMAFLARGGSFVAASLGRQHDPHWALAADAWLGLSWGYLSTLPKQGTLALASGLAHIVPSRPVKRTQVVPTQAVAPQPERAPGPGVLTPV